ncbi:MAG: Stp1/IreP family PP2C-type Ser/Thr phosphatase [Firmicutes bacterium]|nr:Stp1/IreP family PP2C-type Ser/Thr phosphatase [Bacillota bacterium]
MRSFGNSVAGMQRKNNEDSIYVGNENLPVKNIFIVADGMGGHNAGEVASGHAIEKFVEYVKDNYDSENILDVLLEGVIAANKAVYDEAVSTEHENGMGTTFTCACIENEKLYAVHVGDSRIYILKDEKLQQITNDHSFVMEMVKQGRITLEEARVHPKRNIITRAVGTEETIDVDTVIKDFGENDVVLICSDGLSGMICDDEIEKIIKENEDVNQCIEKLIDRANENGGKDNISAIIIRNEVKA